MQDRSRQRRLIGQRSGYNFRFRPFSALSPFFVGAFFGPIKSRCSFQRGHRSDNMNVKSGKRVKSKPLPESAKTRDRSSLLGTSGTGTPLLTESSAARPSVGKSAPTRYRRILFLLFLGSLPLVNPLIHGDGVGYYAYARAPLIQHNLRFEQDWLHANSLFTQSRTLPNGQLSAADYTE